MVNNYSARLKSDLAYFTEVNIALFNEEQRVVIDIRDEHQYSIRFNERT
jgi:hypothetical protein